MNVQMAYWMTEAANLSECHMALFDWIDSHSETMERQCEAIFGAKDSVYIPQYTDVFMVPSCWKEYGPFQVLWSGAAPWLAAHYYQHWQYTGDDEFARTRAFPFMKRCMNLYLYLLTKDSNGKYVLAPTTNPENWAGKEEGQLVHTATLDIALIHELAQNLIKMNRDLGLNDPMEERWQDVDSNMMDYPVDETGLLREWVDDREPTDPIHRHMSHLYGVYPSKLFYGHEDLTAAAMKALDKRLSGDPIRSTTWSFAWDTCLFVRLGCIDRAMEFFGHLIHGGLLSNLLTTLWDWKPDTKYYVFGHKLFQIDALLGICGAICEMLVTEYDAEIYLLPALPQEWKEKGAVKGFRLQHGVELDFRWSAGQITTIEARAPQEKELQVRFPDGSLHVIKTTAI